MYKFWYDYVNSEYVEKLKLCDMGTMDTDSFVVNIKTDKIKKKIQKNFKI